MQVLCKQVLSFLLNGYLGVELLHHMVTLCLKNYKTTFQCGCTIFLIQQCVRVLIFPCSCQHLLLSFFLILTLLVGVK